jgi:hypothetical protein
MAHDLPEQVTSQIAFTNAYVTDTASGAVTLAGVGTSFYYTDTIAADRQSRIFRALLAQ